MDKHYLGNFVMGLKDDANDAKREYRKSGGG